MIETNRAELIGFLGADPERKENGNGYKHLVLSVATSTSWKKPKAEEWETRTEWHRVVVWGKAAMRLNLSKGDKVLVVGDAIASTTTKETTGRQRSKSRGAWRRYMPQA
jgi:single-strand DNA-binding protein